MRAAIADNTNIMSKYVGLWKRICKFFGIKSVSDGDRKGNAEGRKYGVSRPYSDPESLVYMKDGRIITLRELYSKKPVFAVINETTEFKKGNTQNEVRRVCILN